MGTVFCGEHERIARCAAIKVLAPEFASNAEILGRFFDEARATSSHSSSRHRRDPRLRHSPGRATALHRDGVPGRARRWPAPLEREGTLPWPEACAITAQIADGLGAAHRHRIVHRDVKPANLMRIPDPGRPAGAATLAFVKVLDFGVAKLLQDTQSGARTHPGKLLGTPEYMAPEQCGAEGDRRRAHRHLRARLRAVRDDRRGAPVSGRQPRRADRGAPLARAPRHVLSCGRSRRPQRADRAHALETAAGSSGGDEQRRLGSPRPAGAPANAPGPRPPEGAGVTHLGRTAPTIAHARGPDQVSPGARKSPAGGGEIDRPRSGGRWPALSPWEA